MCSSGTNGFPWPKIQGRNKNSLYFPYNKNYLYCSPNISSTWKCSIGLCCELFLFFFFSLFFLELLLTHNCWANHSHGELKCPYFRKQWHVVEISRCERSLICEPIKSELQCNSMPCRCSWASWVSVWLWRIQLPSWDVAPWFQQI